MLVHNNNKIYIHKKTVHWSSTLRIVCIVIFSLSNSSCYFCVLFYIQYLLYGALARRNIMPFFFISLTKKKNKNVLFFVYYLVTKQYRMHEQKNMKINRESACVYAYAIISLSLKNWRQWNQLNMIFSSPLTHLCLIPTTFRIYAMKNKTEE